MDDGENVKVFQQGPDFDSTMAGANIVQASAGHDSSVFYEGDGTSLWKCASDCPKGRSGWQRIVPADDGLVKIALC